MAVLSWAYGNKKLLPLEHLCFFIGSCRGRVVVRECLSDSAEHQGEEKGSPAIVADEPFS